MVQRYLTSEAGAMGFRQWLIRHDYTWVMNPVEVKMFEKVYHYIIKTEQETFYCLFKECKDAWSKERDTTKETPNWFWTFPDKFKLFFEKYPDLNSAGESINLPQFTRCINENFTIIYIYSNGSFYKVDKFDILNKHELAKEFYPEGYNKDSPNDEGFKRLQKIQNRYTDNFNPVDVQEVTMSFPIRILKRLE